MKLMSYILDTTPLIDYLGTSLIAKHTEEDPIFSQLLDILSNLAKNGYPNLPQTSYKNLNLFLTKSQSQETTFY